MDSITQAVLGAAVGEAVLGSRVGRKAAVWGAVAGTIPDLDIVTTPFFPEQVQLALHRGISHSVTFAVVAGIAGGWALSRLYRSRSVGTPIPPRTNGPHAAAEVGALPWMLLVVLAFLTHSLLDAFTVYGTQLWLPFSNARVAWSSVFIIDPLYTVPLIVGLIGAWRFRRELRRRRVWNSIGLVVSSLYLVLTLVNKSAANDAFHRELARQGLPETRVATSPTAVNSVLWMALVEDPANDSVLVGFHSLLDGPGPIEFQRVQKHSDRLAPLQDNPAVERLLWFSDHWFTVAETDRGLVFHDVRFGRSDGWLTERGQFLFSFLLPMQPGNPEREDFRTLSMGVSRDGSTPSGPSIRSLLPRFLRRIGGDRSP